MFQAAYASFFSPLRRAGQAALPGDPVIRDAGARERHARALSHAARRRRAALGACDGAEAIYWKAAVPAALARAAELRTAPGFARLPG